MTKDIYNPLLKADSYKYSHFLQYPPGTEEVYAYLESRGGAFNNVLWFGLQAILKENFLTPFSRHDIDEAEEEVVPHGLPFNRAGFDYILDKHGGYWPVEIKSLPEGMLVPTHVPTMTVRGTDSKVPWVPLFLETELMRVWYPSTVATVSWHAKQLILDGLKMSCDNPDAEIDFKLHDFGARGVSSLQSAALGGMAHIVNFKGTDTMSGIIGARRWYNAEGPIAFSIPAAEHSTITSWGVEGEKYAYQNMIKQFGKPNALVAVVSDSYDLYNAVRNIWGDQLYDDVIKSGATIVIRPDSGEPTHIVPQVLDMLGEKFGLTTNSKGFRVLPKCIRVIQGDGININSIPDILGAIMNAGWSTENVAFGMGGGLLQLVNRDTLRWAMKGSSIILGGHQYDINKNPVTDPGKASKKGRFAVISEKGHLECVPLEANAWRNEMRTTLRNGELLIDDNFSLIQNRSRGIMTE